MWSNYKQAALSSWMLPKIQTIRAQRCNDSHNHIPHINSFAVFWYLFVIQLLSGLICQCLYKILMLSFTPLSKRYIFTAFCSIEIIILITTIILITISVMGFTLIQLLLLKHSIATQTCFKLENAQPRWSSPPGFLVCSYNKCPNVWFPLRTVPGTVAADWISIAVT